MENAELFNTTPQSKWKPQTDYQAWSWKVRHGNFPDACFTLTPALWAVLAKVCHCRRQSLTTIKTAGRQHSLQDSQGCQHEETCCWTLKSPIYSHSVWLFIFLNNLTKITLPLDVNMRQCKLASEEKPDALIAGIRSGCNSCGSGYWSLKDNSWLQENCCSLSFW